jgi:hypothetical protein
VPPPVSRVCHRSISDKYIKEEKQTKRKQPTNNQAFYSQASWGRLEMKPHEQKKKGTKQERKRRGKQGDIKKNKSKK